MLNQLIEQDFFYFLTGTNRTRWYHITGEMQVDHLYTRRRQAMSFMNHVWHNFLLHSILLQYGVLLLIRFVSMYIHHYHIWTIWSKNLKTLTTYSFQYIRKNIVIWSVVKFVSMYIFTIFTTYSSRSGKLTIIRSQMGLILRYGKSM